MFKKFIEWLKRLLNIDQPKPLQDPSKPVDDNFVKNPLSNFLSCPIIYVPEENTNPSVGIVSAVLFGTDNVPMVKFFDYVTRTDMYVTNNFRLFSNSLLKTLTEMSVKERIKYLYPEINQEHINFDNGEEIYGFEKLSAILEEHGFYEVADIYFRTLNSRET